MDLGIRGLSARCPELIPWAWGINGYTSVLGSVMAVMLAIELGFMVVLLIAAGVYALGVVGYTRMTMPRPVTEAEPELVREPLAPQQSRS